MILTYRDYAITDISVSPAVGRGFKTHQSLMQLVSLAQSAQFDGKSIPAARLIGCYFAAG
jgi:hypothetical protein